ncbi:MAG: CRTAC1 family protein [Planctomycetales bacterium]|nr:CRTAC1 family protein [Planctomycetales bacterium]
MNNPPPAPLNKSRDDDQFPETPPFEMHVDDGDDAVIGRAFKGSLLVFVCLGLVGGIIAIWKFLPQDVGDPDTTEVVLPEYRDTKEVAAPRVNFTDVTREAGIDFVHVNGAMGEKMLPETMGSGCAFFDFDSDGDQDLLFVNSTYWPWDPRNESDNLPTLALFANDGQGHFENVTATQGLNHSMYGMGVAAGDYDNDGLVDLFISAVGENRLFRNTGSGFADVTAEAGVAGAANAWSTSCGWVDYDNDGDLDLFVCNYVEWSRDIDLAQDFRLTGIGRAYGPPNSFAGSYPYLYRNEGEGRFRDVSAEAGVQQTNQNTGVPLAKSLGLAPIDLDRDGWIDLIVANDTVRNLVFRNQHDGTFREVGMETGVAYDSSGKARGAMGIDAAAFRNDSSIGVAIANFANEMTALYVSSGNSLLFTDDAIPTGLGPATRLDLSFGLFFFDYDLDGRLDLMSANGHLENEINVVQESQQYEQPARLFWNAGDQSTTEFLRIDESHCGKDLLAPMVGRGTAYADIDNDGDLDVVLTQTGGAPKLLRNDLALDHHFLRLQLRGTSSNRDAIGAWVEATLGTRTIRRQVMPTRSYLSQVELPVTIGLGDAQNLDALEVVWPDGSRQTVTDYQADGLTVVEQSASATGK